MRASGPTLPVDIDYVPGTELTVALTVVDQGTAPIGSFAGWVAKAQVRPYPSSAMVLLEWNLSPSAGQGQVTLTAGTPSLAAVTFTPALSASWSWTHAVWDFLLGPSPAQVVPIARGTVTLLPPISR